MPHRSSAVRRCLGDRGGCGAPPAAPPDPRSYAPSLPPLVAEIVLRCLARSPADRFASASALREVLEAIEARSSMVPPAANARRAPRWRAAILPVVTRSPSEAYLADGVAAEIIELLGPVEGLDVAPHGLSSHLAARDSDALVAARTLGAQVVLSGTLSVDDGRRVVSVELASVEDGIVLWQLTRDLAEPAEAAWEIASGVAKNLGVGAPTRRASVHHEALDLYMRGRHVYHQAWVNRTREAVDLLRRARDLAPDSAHIATGLALASVRSYAVGEVSSEDLERTQELLESLLARDPRSPEARLALASLYLQRNEFVVGAEQLRRCLVVAPDLPDALDWKGRLLLEVGPVEAGIRALDAAAAIEPRLAHVDAYVARGLVLIGDREGAAERILRCTGARVDDGAAHWALSARLAFWMSDRELFATCASKARASGSMSARMAALLESLEGAITSPSDARNLEMARATRAASHVSRSTTFFAQRVAEHAGVLGRADAVLEAIQDAISLGLLDLAWIDGCPLLACARGSEGFAQLRAQVAVRAERVRAILLDERISSR